MQIKFTKESETNNKISVRYGRRVVTPKIRKHVQWIRIEKASSREVCTG